MIWYIAKRTMDIDACGMWYVLVDGPMDYPEANHKCHSLNKYAKSNEFYSCIKMEKDHIK